MRSLDSAYKAAVRDAERAQRRQERQLRQFDKELLLQEAEEEVQEYRDHVERLKSLQEVTRACVDWVAISSAPEPREPTYSRQREIEATTRAREYKFSWIDRLFKRQNTIRNRFETLIHLAIQEDKADFQRLTDSWVEEHHEWYLGTETARGVLSGDPVSRGRALELANTFAEMTELGIRVSADASTKDGAAVDFEFEFNELVPAEEKRLLKTGRVSAKRLTRTRYHGLCQTIVCGCALRIANDVLAILPDSKVLVTAVEVFVNKQTGHIDNRTILSVFFTRTTMEALNMEQLDPAECMVNFEHRMSFKPSTGFRPIERFTI